MSYSVKEFAAALDRAINPRTSPPPTRSNWTPLIELVGEKCSANFMFMGDADNLNLYKHVNTRRYLNIDRVTLQTYRFVPARDLDEAKAGKAHYEEIPVQRAIVEALS